MAWWLTLRTPDPEVGVRAPLGSPCCVLERYMEADVTSYVGGVVRIEIVVQKRCFYRRI